MSRETHEQVVVRGIIEAGHNFLNQPGRHNAFLGISLDKPISERHLSMYVEWVLSHARHCPIIIDDIEARHNYVVFKKITEDKARILALERGDNLAITISGIVAEAVYPFRQLEYVQQHPEDHRGHAISVKRASEGLVEASFLEPLIRTYHEDEQFRQAVQGQIDHSIGKRLDAWKVQVTAEDYSRGRERLARFVLEETAVTLGIVERQYEVELYVGSPIQVVVDLYNPAVNKYPKLKEELNIRGDYGHISLGIQRT